VGLAGVLILNAASDVVLDDWMQDHLDHLRFPKEYREVLPMLKTLAAGGLLLGLKRPWLRRLTARSLVVYFVLAVGYHVQAKDGANETLPALLLLGWSLLAVRARTDGSVRRGGEAVVPGP
jgi:hypothetical protein